MSDPASDVIAPLAENGSGSVPPDPQAKSSPRVWTWPFPNRLSAIIVPLLTLGEITALSFADNHLDYTDAPTVFTSTLLTFAMWWFLAWALSFVNGAIRQISERRYLWWLGRFVLSCAATVFISAWLGSWWLYFTTGRFASTETIRFLVQTFYHWDALWMPAASLRGWVVIAIVGSILSGLLVACWRPRWIREAIARSWSRGLLRFGYTLLALYIAWIGLTWWCLSGLSELRKMERSESFSQKTSPLVTLALSSLKTLNTEPIPADALDPNELVSLDDADRTRARSLAIPGQPYNVIIVQIESLRSDCIEQVHQGNEVTPNINRLASGGIRFLNAHSQSTHSNYADPCIASSLYPLRGRVPRSYRRGDRYPKSLIFDVLKPRGFATAIISSQNESWFGMDQFYQSPHLDLIFDPQRFAGESLSDIRDWGMTREVLSGKLKGGKFVDSFTTGKAIEWIQARSSANQRFCLQMNLQSSHFPYSMPAKVPRPFTPCVLDFPASFIDYPEDKAHVVRNAYYNAIAECDRQVGRIADALREINQFENTIFVVVGENGESFHEDGTVTHGGPPSQVQLRVAWVMTAPGMNQRKTIDYPVELVDVVPTTLGLLGLPPDANHQGIDVLADDHPQLAERFLFFHVNSPSFHGDATIWGGRWKFINFHPGTWQHAGDPTGRGEALFDLHADVDEKSNLIEKRPKIAGVLRARLQRWRLRQLAYYQYPQFYLQYCPPSPTIIPEPKP